MTKINFIDDFARIVNDLASQSLNQSIELANLKTSLGKLDDVLEHYQHAQRMLAMLGRDDNDIAGQITFHIADVLQQQGNSARAMHQYEIGLGLLGHKGMMAVLSEWFAGYLIKLNYTFFLNSNELDIETVAGIDELFSIFIYSADTTLNEEDDARFSSVFLRPPRLRFISNTKSLTQVIPRFSDDEVGLQLFMRFIGALTAVVDSLDLSKSNKSREVALDDLYTLFYNASLDGEFSVELADDCTPDEI